MVLMVRWDVPASHEDAPDAESKRMPCLEGQGPLNTHGVHGLGLGKHLRLHWIVVAPQLVLMS